MKASIFQKCGLALALALTPFLGGCDPGQAMSATINDGSIQVAQAQPPPDAAVSDADTSQVDAGPASAADIADGTNADAALENANGKLISSPDSAGTNVSNNPQLTDFVKLEQAGVGQNVLLAYVTNSASAFSLSSDDIIYLNDLGTPEAVVTAMLQKDQQMNGVAAAAPAQDDAAPPMNPNVMAGAGNMPSVVDLNAAVQTPPMIPSEAVEEEVQQAPNSSYTYFYDSLAPYGNWVNIDGYGPCWQPTVVVANSGWSPYSDRGRWAYTDCGWCWVSDYSWGWAPFHYGRWFRNSHYGWCWAPDTVWGPAWVSWRYSDAYCGWAPLPPSACYRPGFGFSYYGRSVGFTFGFGLSASHFTFVGLGHFHDRYPARYRVEHREVTKIYNTTIINNQIIRGANHNLINRGVPVDRVAAASHQEIRPIRIRADADGPRSPRLGRDGNSLAVYRPELPTPRQGQAPRLVGEGVKPAPNFNLRARVEENRARAEAPRTTVKGAYAPAVTPDRRPIIGNQNVEGRANAARDNRYNQPGNERPGSLIMRGANQPDRQNPTRTQNDRQFEPALPNQPDRGDNRRVVTPPMTPGGQPFHNQGDNVRQNPGRDFNQPSTARPDVDQSQRQQRQLLQQQQRDFQQQQQTQQRDLQQQQRQQPRDFQQSITPRQETPNRSFDTPREQQPRVDSEPTYRSPARSEGTPRMYDSRPAPEMRSTPQYTPPARSDNGGGNRGGNDGGGRSNNNNNNNDNGSRGGRGR